jgi:Ammonium Transporter Family
MKFGAMLLFLTLWSLFVYDPMAHMVWGKGGFLNASLGGRFPTLDFAGGTVVHITSGVSALVCALYLGKRLGYPRQSMMPHSVVISFIGACLLWVGLASTPAARSRLAVWRQALSWRRISRRQRRWLDGEERSGWQGENRAR